MPSPKTIAELATTAVQSGHGCANCGSPVDDSDKFCNVCGTPQPTAEKPAAPAATRDIHCKNCGATITVPGDQLSVTCPFCDSNYVVEVAGDASQRQPPEFVVGFALTPQQALEKFSQWLKEGGMFRPGDMHLARIEDKLRGVYLPFWSFSMLAAKPLVGEHRRTLAADRNLHRLGRRQAGDANPHRYRNRVVAPFRPASQLLQRLSRFGQQGFAARLCRADQAVSVGSR